MRAAFWREVFPVTAVRAATSSSGELRAAMRAMTSSVPGSVSMMTLFMFGRSLSFCEVWEFSGSAAVWEIGLSGKGFIYVDLYYLWRRTG